MCIRVICTVRRNVNNRVFLTIWFLTIYSQKNHTTDLKFPVIIQVIPEFAAFVVPVIYEFPLRVSSGMLIIKTCFVIARVNKLWPIFAWILIFHKICYPRSELFTECFFLIGNHVEFVWKSYVITFIKFSSVVFVQIFVVLGEFAGSEKVLFCVAMAGVFGRAITVKDVELTTKINYQNKIENCRKFNFDKSRLFPAIFIVNIL